MKAQRQDFRNLAKSKAKKQSILGDFWGFLVENKKWWLIPLVVTFLILGGLVFLSGSGASPFIYTLF